MENSTHILTLHACTHTPSCMHIVYTLSYTHAHINARANVAAALTDPVLVSVNSGFAHSSELEGLVNVSG